VWRRSVGGLVVAGIVVGAGPGPAAELATAAPSTTDADAPASTVASTPRLVTPVLSARRAPDLLAEGVARRRLDLSVAELAELAPPTSCLVVADGDDVVVRRQGDLPVAPASTQKLLTAAALVDRLGVEHRMATTVLGATDISEDGMVDGDVFLIGGGDPVLITAGHRSTLQDEQRRLTTGFEALADALDESGLTEIRGALVADDLRYDTERYVATWPKRYQRQDTVGPLSALSVNDGSTGYADTPGEPASERLPGDPPMLAAQTLETLLGERGITVVGGVRTGSAPVDGVVLASIDAPSTGELLGEILGWSDNSAAELQLKELGLAGSGNGTTEAGLDVVREVLSARGLPLDGVVLRDGSGLDEGNRVTCDLLVALLRQEQQLPSSPIIDNLAVAGESGTLAERLVGTPAEGRVRAKTGTLNLVLSLAGVVDTTSGRALTFAFVMNIPPEGDPDATTELQDRLVEALVAYPDAPDPASLAPAPPA
jgi:D-alanyl-D-alanine carboxypeptidase/D-alanyl-D-alanine-endopeptidase (penicillin-binding protein 4)